MTLAIPDDVVSALRLPPEEIESELRKELALALEERGYDWVEEEVAAKA